MQLTFADRVSVCQKQIHAWLQRPFIRHVAMVATGTALAQLLTIAFYPIITRVYGPTAFGILGVFLSAVSLLVPISGLTYPTAIVLPKSDRDAAGLVRLSLLVGVGAALVVALLLSLFGEPIGKLLQLQQTPGLVAILPAAMLALTAQQSAQQWLVRTKQFALTSKVAVFQSLLVNVSKVGFGLLLPYALTLIIVTIFGLACHAATLWLCARRISAKSPRPPHHTAETSLAVLAKTYRDFPIYRAPQDLVNAISQGLPIIVLATFYGPAAAGFFVLARSVLSAPLELIGNSIGTVLYPRLAEAANTGEKLWRLVALPTGLLFALGAFPFGVIFAFGPIMFEALFGPEWHEAGEYARWMALWVVFMFANIPSVRVIPVIRLQQQHLAFGLFVIVVRLGAMAIGYYAFDSGLYSVILYSLSGAALNATLIIYVLYRTRDFDIGIANRSEDGHGDA